MVEEIMPKIMAMAKPLNTGSRVMIKLPSSVVPAVSNTGRILTAPACSRDSLIVAPACWA